jgi:hypothetical protein
MCPAPLNVCTRPRFNWNRFTTANYETCEPFTHYVRPDTVGKEEVTSFRPFPLLPRELQLRIIHCCDQSTLFQLMHVSSTTRYEAEQLFWSDQDAWYSVQGEWLLAGGFTGHTCDAIDFLTNVRQVELHFPTLRSFGSEWPDIIPKPAVEKPSSEIMDMRIDKVWRLLLEKCPRLAHLVVSEGHELGATQWSLDVHTRLHQKCPANVSIRASYLQRTTPSGQVVTRILYQNIQANSSAVGAWTVVNPQWTRKIVLPPHKTFRGPVGAFQRIGYDLDRYMYQHRTLFLLRTKAAEKHYLDEDTAQAEQINRRHKQDREDAIGTLRRSWGVLGTEQRRVAEHAFLSQLEHDPLYTCSRSAKQTFLWNWYKATMNDEEYFD